MNFYCFSTWDYSKPHRFEIWDFSPKTDYVDGNGGLLWYLCEEHGNMKDEFSALCFIASSWNHRTAINQNKKGAEQRERKTIELKGCFLKLDSVKKRRRTKKTKRVAQKIWILFFSFISLLKCLFWKMKRAWGKLDFYKQNITRKMSICQITSGCW